MPTPEVNPHPSKPSSTARNTERTRSSELSRFHRIGIWILDVLLRPTIVGRLDPPAGSTIYVLNFRSLIDIGVLHLATRKAGSPNPLENPLGIEHERSFFCLRRSAGVRRQLAMFKFSERFLRLHNLLTQHPNLALQLVPVQIQWGRFVRRDGSLSQRLFSEKSNLTLGFRRFICLLFNRSDIVIHFGEPIAWQHFINRDHSVARNLRSVARELRQSFTETQIRVAGPENPTTRRLARSVLKQANTTPEAAESAGDSNRSTNLAQSYYRTIRTHFSYPVTKLFKLALGPFWSRCFTSVETIGLDALLHNPNKQTYIYVPNHRSHLDYVVLSYVLFQHGLAIPHVASGDNLNLPIVGGLLRRVGAFFIKRSFHDLTVYRQILESYLYEIVNVGNSVEFFIEGTRSRTGWMLPPQYGFAQLLLQCQARGVQRPLAIVPVYIAYERLLEMKGHRTELGGGEKRNESVLGIVRNLLKLSRKMGSLTIRFGEPQALDPYTRNQPITREVTANFGNDIIQSINAQACMNAVHLVSLAVAPANTNRIANETLLARVDFIQTLLRADSLNHNYQVDRDTPQSILLRVSAQYDFEELEGETILAESFLEAAFWFRNNVLHLLTVPALIVSCLSRLEPRPKDSFLLSIKVLSELFQNLLVFRLDGNAVERWLQHLQNYSLLTVQNESIQLSTAASQQDFIRLLRTLIEPWFSVIDHLIQVEGPKEVQSADVLDDESEHLESKSHHTQDPPELPLEFQGKVLETLRQSLNQWLHKQEHLELDTTPNRLDTLTSELQNTKTFNA